MMAFGFKERNNDGQDAMQERLDVGCVIDDIIEMGNRKTEN